MQPVAISSKTRAAVPGPVVGDRAQRAKDGAKGGAIINTPSLAGLLGNYSQTNYATAKAGAAGFTRTLALETRKMGVTVNAIAPGAFPTDAEKIHPDPEGYSRMVLDAQSIKRRGTAHDIANAIAFFASEESGFVTGQTLHVNGGWTMN